MTDLEKTKKFFKELGIKFRETNEHYWGKPLPNGEVRIEIREGGTNFMMFTVDGKFIEMDSWEY